MVRWILLFQLVATIRFSDFNTAREQVLILRACVKTLQPHIISANANMDFFFKFGIFHRFILGFFMVGIKQYRCLRTTGNCKGHIV